MDFYTWMRQCWPTRQDLDQLCADTGCSLENLSVKDEESGNSVLSLVLNIY